MSIGEGAAWGAMHSFSQRRDPAERPPARETLRRVLTYARRHARPLGLFVGTILVTAVSGAATPLLLRFIIDDGVAVGDRGAVVWGAATLCVLAIIDLVMGLVGRLLAARVGTDVMLELKRELYEHVLRQPISFFTRSQTGSIISRINNDVAGAQQVLTLTLSQVVSNALTLVLAFGAMVVLSWQITLVLLVLAPFFLLPARYVGRRLADLSRRGMELNAELSGMMSERFNVGGALLVKIFGQLGRETARFNDIGQQVRTVSISRAMHSQFFFVGLTFLGALATAIVYGAGGLVAIDGGLKVGTIVALSLLLARLYGPMISLANVQVDIMTALVSFERVFELLDLRPSVRDEQHARPLRAGSEPLSIRFRGVRFRYPAGRDVSLPSLQIASNNGSASTAEAGDEIGDEAGGNVLRGVTFDVEPGQMAALVGPSGAGKSTITHLVARLHDADDGVVQVGDHDVRAVTLESLHHAVGVVTQDAHMFHDTIRANLLYARPTATESELLAALRLAHISKLVEELPDGLDTIVGDRGYRLSGGERQRMAIARLLLKAPRVVVLDEATAHLDSESEAAVQRALGEALTGRTSLVIAHRLSTIRHADIILVVDAGRIVEAGSHHELLANGGMYADLYHTQFAHQEPDSSGDGGVTAVAPGL